MKCIIVYYSQTGNTKIIAQAIHSGMSKAAKECDIAFLGDFKSQTLEDYDLIGIGAPVWYGREPKNVTEFVEDMPRLEGKLAFTYCTHGTVPGGFIARMVTALKGKGLIISGWNDWFGGLSQSMGPNPYYTDGHPDQIDIDEAEAFGREIVERSQGILNGQTGLIPDLLTGTAYIERYGIMGPPPPEGEEPKIMEPPVKAVLVLDKEKCKYPNCTTCMDNCPTHSINPSLTSPHNSKTCEGCMFCEQVCPTGALSKDMGVNKNSDPTMFIEAARQLFEAKELRKFRSIVPFDDVRFDKPPDQVPCHPKLILRDGVGVPRKRFEAE